MLYEIKDDIAILMHFIELLIVLVIGVISKFKDCRDHF